MARIRTVWRFSSPDFDLMCQIHLLSHERAAVKVTENGHVVDRRTIRDSGGEALREAWQQASALHRTHHRRAVARLAKARRQQPEHLHANDRHLQRRLLPAIHRVEQARTRVLRDLDSLESHAHDIVSAVKNFRAAWEALDLEHHVLTGKSLSPEQYRRQLRPRAGHELV